MVNRLAKKSCLQCSSKESTLQWQDLSFCCVACLHNFFTEEHPCANCESVLESRFLIARRTSYGIQHRFCSKECLEQSCVKSKVCEFCLLKKKNPNYGIGCNPILCSEKCQQSFNGFYGKSNMYYCGICHLAKYVHRSENILIGEHVFHESCWSELDCRSVKKKCIACKVSYYTQFNGELGHDSGVEKTFCSLECKLFFTRKNDEYVKCSTCDKEVATSVMISNSNGVTWCSLECLTGSSKITLFFDGADADIQVKLPPDEDDAKRKVVKKHVTFSDPGKIDRIAFPRFAVWLQTLDSHSLI